MSFFEQLFGLRDSGVVGFDAQVAMLILVCLEAKTRRRLDCRLEGVVHKCEDRISWIEGGCLVEGACTMKVKVGCRGTK
jgi:hypothetical protein